MQNEDSALEVVEINRAVNTLNLFKETKQSNMVDHMQFMDFNENNWSSNSRFLEESNNSAHSILFEKQ